MSEFLIIAIGYIAMGGLTSGIYAGMASAQGKDAPNPVMFVVFLLWPFFLPLALGAIVMTLIL